MKISDKLKEIQMLDNMSSEDRQFLSSLSTELERRGQIKNVYYVERDWNGFKPKSNTRYTKGDE